MHVTGSLLGHMRSAPMRDVTITVPVAGALLAAFSDLFLVRNGGMDPYDSPLRSPIVVPITHSRIPN